jgi:hypothetical protein
MTQPKACAGRRCQQVLEQSRGGGQCPQGGTWVGSLHAGRRTYLVTTCEQHMSGLLDAEPYEDDAGVTGAAR